MAGQDELVRDLLMVVIDRAWYLLLYCTIIDQTPPMFSIFVIQVLISARGRISLNQTGGRIGF